MRAAGVIFSTSMARDLLFGDEAKERNQSPHVSRWVRADQMVPRGLRFELDLGSVLNINDFMTYPRSRTCSKSLRGEHHSYCDVVCRPA